MKVNSKNLLSSFFVILLSGALCLAIFLSPSTYVAAQTQTTSQNFTAINPESSLEYLDLSETETFSAWGKVILTPTANTFTITDLFNKEAKTLSGGNLYGGNNDLIDCTMLGERYVGVITNEKSTTKYQVRFYWTENPAIYTDDIKDSNGKTLLESTFVRKFYTSADGSSIYVYGAAAIHKINFSIKEDPANSRQTLDFTSVEKIAENLTILSDFAVYGNSTDGYSIYYLDGGKLKCCFKTNISDVALEEVTDITSFSISQYHIFINEGQSIKIYNRSNPNALVSEFDGSEGIYGIKNVKKMAYMNYNQTQRLVLLNDTAKDQDYTAEGQGYTAEGQKGQIIYSVTTGKLQGEMVISTSGAAADKLNAPEDVKVNATSSVAYVADSNNNRITVISQPFDSVSKKYSSFSTNIEGVNASAPVRVAIDDNYIYVATRDSKILYFDATSYEYKFSRTWSAGAQTTLTGLEVFDGKIYFAESSTNINGSHRIGYFADSKSTIPTIFNISSQPLALALNNRGSKLYCATPTSIIIYNTKDMSILQTVSFADLGASNIVAQSISVDYAGNIFIADNYNYGDRVSGITKLKRTKTGYELACHTELKTSLAHIDSVDAVEIAADGKIVALSKTKNILLFSNGTSGALTSVAKNSTAPPSIATVQACRVNSITSVYYALDNYEEFISAPVGSLFLTLASKTEGGKTYYYGVFEDGFAGYIEASHVTALTPNSNTDIGSEAIALHPTGVTVYTYPFITNDTALAEKNNSYTLSQDRVLTVINNVAEYQGTHVWQTDKIKWYRIQYSDANGFLQHGYVQKNAISANSDTTPPATKKTMKVSADTVGGTISLYSLPDIAASVLATLPDSTEVLLAEDYDENSVFTKVVFKNQVGYVLTKNLIKGGLTTGQIVAVVFGCIAGVITIISSALLIVYVKRKKRGV